MLLKKFVSTFLMCLNLIMSSSSGGLASTEKIVENNISEARSVAIKESEASKKEKDVENVKSIADKKIGSNEKNGDKNLENSEKIKSQAVSRNNSNEISKIGSDNLVQENKKLNTNLGKSGSKAKDNNVHVNTSNLNDINKTTKTQKTSLIKETLSRIVKNWIYTVPACLTIFYLIKSNLGKQSTQQNKVEINSKIDKTNSVAVCNKDAGLKKYCKECHTNKIKKFEIQRYEEKKNFNGLVCKNIDDLSRNLGSKKILNETTEQIKTDNMKENDKKRTWAQSSAALVKTILTIAGDKMLNLLPFYLLLRYY